MDKDILNLEEAVDYLKTSKPTFYRWLKGGKIKGFKVGREWRFYRHDLVDFLESTNQEKEVLKKELRQANDFYIVKLLEKGIEIDDFFDYYSNIKNI